MKLAYNGQAYHGWQIQPGDISVQETIEKGLPTLLREQVSVVGCGRPDARVHAGEFFLHFDVSKEVDRDELKFRLNSILPDDIAIFEVLKVREGAHARFDAFSRTYQYRIFEGKNPFMIGIVYQVTRLDLDLDKMNRAAGMLTEYSDFQCFSRSKSDVKNFLCQIEDAFWSEAEGMLVFEITSNRFLRNMVRAIVGTMIEIGQGKRQPEDLRRVIESRDRAQAGPSARAEGLHLTRVRYPKHIFIDSNG